MGLSRSIRIFLGEYLSEGGWKSEIGSRIFVENRNRRQIYAACKYLAEATRNN